VTEQTTAAASKPALGALRRVAATTAFRLSALFLVLFSLSAAGLVLYLTEYATRAVRSQLVERVNNDAQTLLAIYESDGLPALIDAVGDRSRAPGANLYLVATTAGDSFAGNIILYDLAALTRTGWADLEYARDDGSIVTRDGFARTFALEGTFRLLIGRDLEEQSRLRAIMLSAGSWGAGGVVLLGLIAAALLSWRVLRRIDTLTETTRTIMATETAARLPTTGSGDELDRLAEAVNAMLDRIGTLMRGLEQVSNDIAHDLRTPLSRLAARTEAALRQDKDPAAMRAALEAGLEDTRELIRTFEALLLIAKAEAGAGHHAFARVDLALIAQEMAELYEPAAEDAGLRLKVSADAPAFVFGHRELLARVIANLIDNGIKYGAQGTPAELSIVVEQDQGSVHLSVMDHGPGIPQEERERVLARFVRLDQSRTKPGYGLGLALVSAIAKLHGADLSLDDAGPGLKISLMFKIPTAA
jgi:signal transduction histidine kinase